MEVRVFKLQKKTISPAAINALKEALTCIYWYKKDLRSFLNYSLTNPDLVNRLNWDDYKRNVISRLVDYLASNEKYMNDLLLLMSEIVKMNDFSHLERLEDGKEKSKNAKVSVKALRKMYNAHEQVLTEQKNIKKRKQEAEDKRLKKETFNTQLEQINQRFKGLLNSSNAQSRGYELEKILKDMFILFDLDPKSSFKVKGEQLDGAFTFENTDYLLEAKWQKEKTGIQDLDAFSAKISRKLDNTLGLFISINGFTDDAIAAHSTGRKKMILMDGMDLMTVLEGRIKLDFLLLRKRRHASQTGNIFLSSYYIL